MTVAPASEDGGAAQFVVTIPRAEPIPVTFTFTTTAGTATAGADFEARQRAVLHRRRARPSASSRWCCWPTRTTRPTRRSPPTCRTCRPTRTGAARRCTATIVNDDPQSIALDGVTVGEAGGQAVFTLRLQAPYNAPVTLAVTTLAGDGLGAAGRPGGRGRRQRLHRRHGVDLDHPRRRDHGHVPGHAAGRHAGRGAAGVLPAAHRRGQPGRVRGPGRARRPSSTTTSRSWPWPTSPVNESATQATFTVRLVDGAGRRPSRAPAT